jgi:peptidoglycan/LPS O-acetylase OafA/YrhL
MTAPRIAPLTGYRPDIQVLRGLAVLLVVMYHADLVFDGGYIGVDMFFVISGFVIGRLILRELLSTGTLSFRDFYTRRFRRILPALALILVTVVLLAPLLAPFGATATTNQTAAASALFSANFFLYSNQVDGYFAISSTLNPLLHTWSLAVEEQFYFTIPAALLLVWRRSRRRESQDPIASARVLVAILTVGSLGLCIAMSLIPDMFGLRSQSFAYFSPFTRAWEFCIGIALVLLPARWNVTRPLTRLILAVAGYSGLLVSALMLSETTTFPGLATLLPVLSTAVAIHAAVDTGPLTRPFVFLGDNSYGWYLWHWPLIVFAAAFWSNAGAIPLAGASVAALVLAVLTRQLLELRLVPRASRRIGTLVAACIVLPFLAIALSSPITARVDSLDAVATAESPFSDFKTMRREVCGLGPALDIKLPEECLLNPDSTRTITLIGDSNATHLAPAMRSISSRLDARIEIVTRTSCPPLIAYISRTQEAKCISYIRGSIENLLAHPRDTVIVAVATSAWLRQEDGRTGTRSTLAEVSEKLSETLEVLASSGARVILIGELPKPKWSAPNWSPENCSAVAAIVDLDRCGFPPYRPDSTGQFAGSLEMETLAVESANVERWTFTDVLCPDALCRQFIDGEPVWRDSGHITPYGAARMEERLLEILSESPDRRADG